MIRRKIRVFPSAYTNELNVKKHPNIQQEELLFGKQEQFVVHGIQTQILHLQKVGHAMGVADYKAQLAEIKRKINYGLKLATAADLSKHANPDLRIHGIGTKIGLKEAQAKTAARHDKLIVAVVLQAMSPEGKELFKKQLKFLKRAVARIEKQKPGN